MFLSSYFALNRIKLSLLISPFKSITFSDRSKANMNSQLRLRKFFDAIVVFCGVKIIFLLSSTLLSVFIIVNNDVYQFFFGVQFVDIQFVSLFFLSKLKVATSSTYITSFFNFTDCAETILIVKRKSAVKNKYFIIHSFKNK